jgi:ribosomal protein L11 methyltransferase
VSYLALRLDVAGDVADALADALLAAGALSVDLADREAGTAAEAPMFDEPGTSTSGPWAVSRLTALFPAAADVPRFLADALGATGILPMPHEIVVVPDEDWVRASEAQFVPQRITEMLWIVPSWRTPVDPAAVNLILDPGLAFGTGSHPTTRLCLRWLAREMRAGAAVLDYGCGSGILAIAAARLGAGRVVGVDIDPQALVAARANAERNAVRASFLSPDEFARAPTEAFDAIVANILANPLRVLAPALAARVRVSGHIVLSGILAAQADEVANSYARWFRIGVGETEDGWVALVGVRSEAPVPH